MDKTKMTRIVFLMCLILPVSICYSWPALAQNANLNGILNLGVNNTYSLADLTGTWHVNSLASGPGSAWWKRGIVTFAPDGSFTQSNTYSDGSSDTGGGTGLISSDGLITVQGDTSNQQCRMDSGKSVFVCTNTLGNGTTQISVVTKDAATYSPADLVGTWQVSALGSGLTPYWIRAMLTVNPDGTYTEPYTLSNGSSSTANGTWLISPDGLITIQGQTYEQCRMDSGKTVIACTGTNGDGTTYIGVYPKKAASYSLADLTGTWHVNSLASGPSSPWWARGILTFASDGSFTQFNTYSDGSSITASGTGLISSGGLITVQGDTSNQQCRMDSGKTVFVCTRTWGNGTTDITVITKKSLSTTDIFFDDFEAYPLASFPSSGGWNLRYGGAGQSYQYVDNSHSTSGSRSLHLIGSSCWGASSYHPVTIPSRVTLEAMVFVDQIVSCGCTTHLGEVSFKNPALGSWGIGFGAVMFDCDGKIYAMQNYQNDSGHVMLMSYSPRTWYRVKINADLTARTFDVYIDGVLRGSALQILDSGMPTGVEVGAEHGANPTVWFDDVRVSELFSDVPDGYWAEGYIDAIYNAQITTGCLQNPLRYCPEDNVTREQMAAFIIRAKEGEPPLNYCDSGSLFPDVTPDMWSCRYVKRLKELGITTGYGDGRYAPYDPVLREQMAAFLVRAVEGEPALNYCDSGSLFSDITSDMWSCKYIKRLKELAITTGYGDGRYGPYDLVKRDQMAAFLSRGFLGMK